MKCQINVKLICHFVKPGKRTTDRGQRGRKRGDGAQTGARKKSRQRGGRVLCDQPGRQSMRIEASSLNASQFAIN